MIFSEAASNHSFLSSDLFQAINKIMNKGCYPIFYYSTKISNIALHDSIWLHFLDLKSSICEEVNIILDKNQSSIENIEKISDNFEFVLEKKIYKLSHLSNLNFRLQNSIVFDLLSYEKLINFLKENKKTLRFVNLDSFNFDIKWENFSDFFEIFCNMNQLISLKLNLDTRKIVFAANSKEVSYKIMKIILNNRNLMDLQLNVRFHENHVKGISNDYDFFLRKKRILIQMMAAFIYQKKKGKYAGYRNKYFYYIFLRILKNKSSPNLSENILSFQQNHAFMQFPDMPQMNQMNQMEFE